MKEVTNNNLTHTAANDRFLCYLNVKIHQNNIFLDNNLLTFVEIRPTKFMIIRNARPADIDLLYELIIELAVYEKAPDAVINQPQQLLDDCFKHNLYHAFVAEHEGTVIGMAICYFRYSTWNGKCLYLEDLYVKESYRGIGAGKALFERCIEYGKETECVNMNWQVLDWNTPAIDFYKGYGTSFDEEWVNGSLKLRV